MTEYVILVDERDHEVGIMEKMEAHRKGKLHRAFSILLLNSKGEMLIQKRATNKYHSAGLWSNACCSHPRPGESMEDATQRRLKEELGINAQPVFSHSFIYKADFSNDLSENEFDHVYTIIHDAVPKVNPTEVEEWRFVDLKSLKRDIINNSQNYTYWFRLIMDQQEINAQLAR